jgi:hypothetical protein
MRCKDVNNRSKDHKKIAPPASKTCEALGYNPMKPGASTKRHLLRIPRQRAKIVHHHASLAGLDYHKKCET